MGLLVQAPAVLCTLAWSILADRPTGCSSRAPAWALGWTQHTYSSEQLDIKSELGCRIGTWAHSHSFFAMSAMTSVCRENDSNGVDGRQTDGRQPAISGGYY